MRNDCTNDTIGKTRKLLENVKRYPIPADYCRYDARKETTGHRYLRRKIRRAYQKPATQSRTLRRGTRRKERDTSNLYLQLGTGNRYATSGKANGLEKRAGAKKYPKDSTGRIKVARSGNPPLCFVTICGKIHSIPFAYGRALVFFTKGGVL